MAFNNPSIYDAALNGAFGGAFANRSEKSIVANDYTSLANACAAYASQLDSLIAHITLGPTDAQLSAIESLSFAAWSNRQPSSLVPTSYANLAAVVKAAWTKVTSLASGATGVAVTAATAVTDGGLAPNSAASNCSITRTGVGLWTLKVPGYDFGLSGAFPTLNSPNVSAVFCVEEGWTKLVGSAAADELQIEVQDSTGVAADLPWSVIVSKLY